jgi:DNA-directed RNA polymerase subunit alpha
MIEIEKPRIDTVEMTADGTYGKFVMEPLERGYATTLGNSMRRVLLSILPGVAVTAVKIDGVVHEFSTLPGVKEDVTEIILNIKGLIAKLHADTAKKIYIEAEGPCVVTAASIKADSEVEILNPDMYIATLDEGATLNMEMTLDRGRGYVSAEQNKLNQNVIGVIPVDSIYTPVLKANFSVDNTRVGNVTDNGAREGYHSNDNDKQAEYGDNDARLTDISDNKLYTACVKNHSNGAECRLDKAHLLGAVKRKLADNES